MTMHLKENAFPRMRSAACDIYCGHARPCKLSFIPKLHFSPAIFGTSAIRGGEDYLFTVSTRDFSSFSISKEEVSSMSFLRIFLSE